jgi:hypothetical protein
LGVLTVEITVFGVVMSADSQQIEALAGNTRVLSIPGQRSRNPILKRSAGGFTGLVGFVGTEEIGGKATRDWLNAFGLRHPTAPLADYADTLAQELTAEWQRYGLRSVLEILIAGDEGGDIQFWYVRNSAGFDPSTGLYFAPKADFDAVPDLDRNYVPNDLLAGETKEELLQRHPYSFWQGVLMPASAIFSVFRDILSILYAHGIPGFAPVASLDDFGYFVRQRLEFVKRLYDNKKGIYALPAAPIGGVVHVVGVDRQGGFHPYPKNRP